MKNLPIDMLIGGEFLLPHQCQITDKASDRDAFGINDGYCDACVRNKEKMKSVHDPQLQATPKGTLGQRSNLSGVAVPTRLTDEQEGKGEQL